MSRIVLFCVVVFLCAVATVCADPPREMLDDGHGFDFFGHAGQIRLWTLDGAHNIVMKFLKLQEVTPAGVVVAQAKNFDTDDFIWTRVGPGLNWNVNFIEFLLKNNELQIQTAAGNNFNVQFQVDTFIFLAAMNATFAGEKISAKKGQIKWQVQVNNWQFQNTSNKLRYGVQLLSDSFANNTAFNKLDPVPATVSSFALAFGKGELIVPRVALVDNKAVNITANILYEAGQLTVQWDFPAGATILYDPVMATSDLIVTTSAAAATSHSGFIMMLAILAAVAAMLRQ
jgi:hypothetical protein